jgi:hypothetical protein
MSDFDLIRGLRLIQNDGRVDLHARECARLAADRIEQLEAALLPFAGFTEQVEQFVEARARDGGSPIMPPTSNFRLADFRRARSALARTVEARSQVTGERTA